MVSMSPTIALPQRIQTQIPNNQTKNWRLQHTPILAPILNKKYNIKAYKIKNKLALQSKSLKTNFLHLQKDSIPGEINLGPVSLSNLYWSSCFLSKASCNPSTASTPCGFIL